MTDNERDTHFQNAAELLSEKLGALYLSKGLEAILGDPNGEIKQQEITLFAQFAYDLAIHAICAYDDAPPELVRELIEHVPDLKKWPTDPDIS